MVSRALLVACMVLVSVVADNGCRNWCRRTNGSVYCCEKDGTCPPPFIHCPPATNALPGPPNICSDDSVCPGAKKCCFDTCLKHHTCKSPLPHGK